jgi:predicted nuclease with TOPRIM domain
MSLTNAQYMLVSELLDEVHEVKKDFIEMKQKVYELEDENYRLKERINELYSMINSVDCSDEIEELTVKLDHLNKF